MRFLIISHTPHYIRSGEVVGWGPTVEEINHLASFFDTIRHVGCLHNEPAPDSALPYGANNIKLVPLPPAGGATLKDKWQVIRSIPLYLKTIVAEFKQCDAVHLRCPANIPFLALLVLLFTKKPVIRWAKYAGNWGAGRDYPTSYRFQRWLLQSGITKCVVTVNGTWPDQKAYIHSFNNPCLTQEEIYQASPFAERKSLTAPYQLLFVGALNQKKGVERLLKIAATLKEEGFHFTLDIVGDGPDRAKFLETSQLLGLSSDVTFHGWLPRPKISDFYSRAHFLLLPSESEGWPKVISEGMAYGVVSIAGGVGSIPEILKNTNAGISITPIDDISMYCESIKEMTIKPQIWSNYSVSATAAAPSFTYEHYLNAVKKLFWKNWNCSL
jgi:glycosyltransferase involved in cell wall biosynthesis